MTTTSFSPLFYPIYIWSQHLSQLCSHPPFPIFNKKNMGFSGTKKGKLASWIPVACYSLGVGRVQTGERQMEQQLLLNTAGERRFRGVLPCFSSYMNFPMEHTQHALPMWEAADVRPILFTSHLCIMLCKDLGGDTVNPLSELCFCWLTLAQHNFSAWKVLLI